MKSLNREKLCLTDGGQETTIIYHYNTPLPNFSAFTLLLNKEKENEILKPYYRSYLDLSIKYNTDFILDTATWRANPDWALKLNIDKAKLTDYNIRAVELAKELVSEYKEKIKIGENSYIENKNENEDKNKIFISGNIGPRHDGYIITEKMDSTESSNYHEFQIEIFKKENCDLITAMTMTYIDEAMGIALSCMKFDIPVVISFTVNENGELPSSESIEDIVTSIDNFTNSYPMHYMINCAHPKHFYDQLKKLNPEILKRIRGFRCNASDKTHDELDKMTELDKGNIEEFGEYHRRICNLFEDVGGSVHVFGGCCGTDEVHLEQIVKAVNGI